MAFCRQLTRTLLATSLFTLTLGAASAQDLGDLLPAETFFALGMQDLEGASAYLEDFRAEFERLGVADALGGLGADAREMMGDGMTGGDMTGGDMTGGGLGTEASGEEMSASADAMMERLGSFASLDVFGQEAWIGLSAASFSPLPALTLLTRLTPEGVEQVQALLDDPELQSGLQEVQELEESGYTFFQASLEDAGSPVQVVAYALADDVLALSTNPDDLRGVLRRLGGADEPSFASSEGFQSTLGTLESGTFYSFLDYARIASVVSPYSQNLGFDRLVTRLSEAFTTAGSVGGVVRLEDDGFVTEGFQALDEEGGDTPLYLLLTDDTAAETDVQVPADALSVGSSATNLSGWYDYLNTLALAVPELGGDLDSLLLSIAGVNLRDTIFSWTGEQVITLTTGLGEVAEPGVPSDNLLGETAYLIETSNEGAAERGLSTLLGNVSQVLSAFGDPQGGAGAAQTQSEEIEGVSVTRFDITSGVSLLYAVTGGYAIIATSEDAMTQTLAAQAGGSGENLSDLLGKVPDGASSVVYTDGQRTFEGLAAQLSSQVQLAAGMGGASGLDFGAVEEASGVVEEFLAFVAERLGPSTGYSEREGSGIRSYSESEVAWQR